MQCLTTCNSHSRQFRLSDRRIRRGSIVGLMAIILPVLAVLVAVVVNASYMQMTRTELIIATDSAARSAGRTFSELQNVNDAKVAARVTAAKNRIANQPLRLLTADNKNEIEFGYTTNTGGNYMKFHFNKVPTQDVANGTSRANAVRVNGLGRHREATGNQLNPIELVFPTFSSKHDFMPSHSSVAMQVDRDIALVLDRSGSMDELCEPWPSGKSPYYYSTLNAGVSAGILYTHYGNYYLSSGYSLYDYEEWAWEDYYELGEYQGTKWESLERAVDNFLQVLDLTQPEEHVAVASYSSSSSASLDIYLQSDYDLVRAEVDTLSPSGSTGIGAGMQKGLLSFLDSAARPYAAKTMVVMTDGIHNSGIDPVAVATSLISQYHLTIHTVTFGADADTTRMQQVATIGGGKHYHAENSQQLSDVFEEIANNLPTLITK
ncbi:MAG: VWA domain-containing protein [Pirellulaceae bacterium]